MSENEHGDLRQRIFEFGHFLQRLLEYGEPVERCGHFGLIANVGSSGRFEPGVDDDEIRPEALSGEIGERVISRTVLRKVDWHRNANNII